MRFLIIVVLGLAASEKLDRIYLPPPGAKLSGGSPGSIQVPLELPKETYQPTGTLVSENGLTSIEKLPYGYGINRAQFDQASTQVPSSYYVENVPTTSTSYAFSQTTTLPTERYGPTPIGSITGLPNQYSTKIPNNFGFVPIPEKPINTDLSSFSQNEQQNFPSFNIAGQPQTGSQFVNNAQKDYVKSNQPLGQYQKTAIPIGSTQMISASPKQKDQSLIQFPERQLFFNQSTVTPEINAFTNNYPQNTSNFQSQSPYYDVNIASNSPTVTVNDLDSFPGQRSETQNLQPSYSQNDYPVGILSQQYPGINELMSFVPGNIESRPLLSTEYYIKPSYSDTTPLPGVTLYPISSNFVHPERPQADADRNAIILNFNNIRTPNGYSYSYDTSNGIHADETGVIDNGTKASGGYSYIGDDGKNYSITYTADENGFQPHGDHLPTPPPIPAAIQKIIEKVAMEEAAGISDDGSYDAKKYGDYKYQEYSNRYNVPSRGYDGLDESEYIGMTRDYGRKPISNINDVISNTQNKHTHEQKKNNLILNENRLVNEIPERKVKDLSQGLVGQDKREELISSPGRVTSTSFNDVSIVQPTSEVNKQHIDSSKRKELTTTRYSDGQDSIPDSTFTSKESISNIDLNNGRFDKLISIERTSSVTGEQSEKYNDNTGYIYNRPQISLEQNRFPNRLRAQETTMIKPFMTQNVNNNKNDAKSSFAFRKPLVNFDVLSPSKESINTDITDNSNDQPKDKSVNRNRFSSARFPTETIGTTSGPSKYFKQTTLSRPFQYSIHNQETAVSKGTPGTNKSDLLKSYTTPMPLQSPQFREETSLKLSKNQNPSSITGLPGSKNKLIPVVTSKSELNPQSFRPNEYISSNLEPGSLAVSNSFRMASENRIIPQSYVSLSNTPIPGSNLNSALMNPVSYQTAYQYGNLESQPSYDAATSGPSLSIPSGSGMYSEVAPGSTYQADYQYRPIDYSLIKGPDTLVPNFRIPQSSQANPIVTYPTTYQYGPALSTTNELVSSDPRKGTVQSYSTTTYKPNISSKGTQAPGINTDNFGSPINFGGISYPGYSAQNSELSSNQSDGSAVNQDYSPENVPRTFDSEKYSDYVTTERVAGEDFSGPKQRQNFDPETGYHYK